MHRAHDYRALTARWKALARKAGLPLRKLARTDGFPLYFLRTPALEASGGIYLSAGIHGDEPGATEGLIQWAEKRAETLATLPLLIFPCLNAWGLVNNRRYDASGNDLNRLFHETAHPLVAAVRAAVAGRQFAASVMLHEDYDGEGIYLYEIQRALPYWGERLLNAAAAHVPLEPRARVDGRRCVGGLIRRKIDFRRFDAIGHPEAIWLQMRHSLRTFTIETPSEFAVERRAAAQEAVLDECLRLVEAQKGLPVERLPGKSRHPRKSL